jgi:hypothetical protein
METTRRPNSLFGPILLIGLGVLLLLSNMGVLTVDVWQLIFRFWPVLLIAAGLDILFGRRSGVGAIIAVVVLVVVIGGSLPWAGGVVAGSTEVRSIQQELAGAERADIGIAAGVSSLTVRSTPDRTLLASGTIRPLRNERIDESFRQQGDRAIYTLQSEGPTLSLPVWNWQNQGRWDLQLTSAVPLDLEISTGVGEATLNLEQLQLSALQINSGVGQTEVTLPSRGNFQGEISGGVGQLTVLVPDTLAVRITATAGLGSVDVQGDFTRDGSVYTSPGYDRADGRVQLNVSGGVGSVTIRQVEKR